MKYIKFLLLVPFVLVSCGEGTRVSSEFNRNGFVNASIGTSTKDFLETAGLPIRAYIHYTDGRQMRSEQELSELSKELLVMESKKSGYYVRMVYSEAAFDNADYIIYTAKFLNGRLASKLEAIVIE